MVILEQLAQDDGGLRLTDLARRTGLSLTTVHRLLTTLEHRRFVQFSQADNSWHVGLQAFAVGSAFSRERNFIAPALPFLRRLRDQTRETANLGVVENGEIVLVNQAPGREVAKSVSAIGGRTPMPASGMGKAILSTYGVTEVQALVRQRGLRPFTNATLTCAESLHDQLSRARIDGFAVDNEEYLPGLRCVAAPVYNERSEVACAISVSGLSNRLTEDRLPGLARIVTHAAGELTAALGGKRQYH